MKWSGTPKGFKAKGLAEGKEVTVQQSNVTCYDSRTGGTYRKRVPGRTWYWSIGLKWGDANMRIRRDGFVLARDAKADAEVAWDALPRGLKEGAD